MPTPKARIEKLEHAYERSRQLDQEIAFLLAQLPPEEAARIMREVADDFELEAPDYP